VVDRHVLVPGKPDKQLGKGGKSVCAHPRRSTRRATMGAVVGARGYSRATDGDLSAAVAPKIKRQFCNSMVIYFVIR
jgi:hypothetical protein